MTQYSRLNPYSIARIVPAYILPKEHRQALDALKAAIARLDVQYGLYWHTLPQRQERTERKAA